MTKLRAIVPRMNILTIIWYDNNRDLAAVTVISESMARNPTKLFPQDYVLRALVLPFIPNFIKPNHVTALRLILTPVVVYLLATNNLMIGVPLFIFTAWTDMLDGSMARVRKQITPWGILFDPVADKLLVGLVVLVFALRYYFWIVVLAAILFDLLPLAIWFVRAKANRGMMMANMWGKSKLCLQILSLIFLMLAILLQVPDLIVAGQITLVIATVLGAIAAVTYSL